MTSAYQAGRDRALADWAAARAVMLVHGDPATDRPTLSPRGFYVSVWDEPDSRSALDHCRGYNDTIDELIAKHGVPAWSPLKRRPTKDEAYRLLTNGAVSFDSYVPQSVKEGRLQRVVVSTWPVPPRVIRHDADRELLLVGGDTNARAARIDVLDVREMRWMARLEFLRKHEPSMPWDGSVSR